MLHQIFFKNNKGSFMGFPKKKTKKNMLTHVPYTVDVNVVCTS